MDIYEYLKLDHKKVTKLFELYKTSSSDKNRLEIIAMIKQELLLHADSEAQTFYKALEAHRKSEDEALHGEEEHEEIKKKIEELSRFTTVNPTLEKKLLELKILVDHHVSDEENKIFNVAKKVLSKEETYTLKEQMHDFKEKILNAMILETMEQI